MKKTILMLILICLLCGCTQPTSQETTAPETIVTVPATEATVPPTEEPVELEAVNTHSFRSSKEKPTVAVLDYRTAAFLTPEHPDKDYTRKCTRVQVVDLYTDTVKCETLLEGTYTPLLHCAAPGVMALVEEKDRNVLVLDRELQQVLSFDAEDPVGILTEDMTRYYYIWGSDICWLDTSAGTVQRLEIDFDLAFFEVMGFDAAENILMASAYTGSYTADICMTAVDLDTAEIALFYQDVSDGDVGEGGMLLERENLEELQSDVFYGEWTDETLRSLPGFLVNDLHFAAWHISGTDYVCRITYDEKMNVDIVEFELFRLGETVTVCSLQEQFDGAKVTQMYALPDGNLLAMETTGRGYRTYLICPELLEFTETGMEAVEGGSRVDIALTEGMPQLVQFQIPGELEAVRNTADALEEEYGVTILISGECTEALGGTGMDITTTDQAGLKDEAQTIERGLKDLDKMLGLYPEGFFRQFRNDSGERGLLILLVEDFESEMGVIGLSWTMGEWYPIAVDITSGEVSNTYCHEIWHATEQRISDLHESALDLNAWENCNPTGFQYSGNTTRSYIEDVQYTYFMGDHDEGVYFVDPYAKTKPQEDRARLMEYIMCSDVNARLMMDYPAMRAKLQILCDAIRAVFDTEGWEEVRWERFF